MLNITRYVPVKMVIRVRFCKRVLVFGFVFGIIFYVSLLCFGDLKVPKVMHLTDLNRCPACYGITVCPELYSNQILLENHRWHSILFNAKNIYHGYTKSNRKVILKKLAHDWELKDFDSRLCKEWNLQKNCKPIDLLNVTNVETRIEQAVRFNITVTDMEPRKGLIFCPYAFGIHEFVMPAINNKKTDKKYKSDLINVWTMLMINPEPIVLQVIPKSKGWHVPAYAGVCGRVEVVANEGEPLSSMTHLPWARKLAIAKQLIDAAMDFTFKHDRFRFYLMDWSADNIVVNDKDQVTFVDLEDIIVIDKHILPKSDLPNWYKRYARDNLDAPNEFSIENLCKHHLSDHNIHAVCHLLAGDDEPLLYPVPVDFKPWPHLATLLRNCLNGVDRFKAGSLLQRYITESLMKDSSNSVGVR